MVPNSHVFAMPEISIGSGSRRMPVLGFGTAAELDAEAKKQGVLQAIEAGYRHFDTAALYRSEQPLGEAVREALSRGLIKSREELFITSKLWCSDAHQEHVLPSFFFFYTIWCRNLKMDYTDLYIIHWPLSAKHGILEWPQHFLPMDFKSVWAAMEECQRLGLTKSIGVSNFSIKKLKELLSTATIPPAVNQVEVNPCWQQKKLIQFCKANGILVVAYSPLGAPGTFYGTNRVMESEVLKEIAEAKGKTLAQVALRWAYEQGIGVVVRSFNRDRMKQNLEIFNWKLEEEETKKISEIPQGRAIPGDEFTSIHGPYKTTEELWDGEI